MALVMENDDENDTESAEKIVPGIPLKPLKNFHVDDINYW